MKKDLLQLAAPWCDAPMKAGVSCVSKTLKLNQTDSFYSAWDGMKTLIKHKLVQKQKSPAQYSLTESGEKLAQALYETKERSVKTNISLPALSPIKRVNSNSTNLGNADVMIDSKKKSANTTFIKPEVDHAESKASFSRNTGNKQIFSY